MLKIQILNSFIKSNTLKTIYTGTLWAEGPAFIPH